MTNRARRKSTLLTRTTQRTAAADATRTRYVFLSFSGKLRALAVMQGERSALLAEVPTLREATGIEGILAPACFGFTAPAKAPTEVRARLEQEIRRALAEPEVKAKLADADLDVVALPAARMAEVIRAETAYNAATIKRLGFRPD